MMSTAAIEYYRLNPNLLKPVDEVYEFGMRVKVALMRVYGIKVIGQLLFIPEEKILNLDNFGRVSAWQLKKGIEPFDIEIGALSELSASSCDELIIPSVDEMKDILSYQRATARDVRMELARTVGPIYREALKRAGVRVCDDDEIVYSSVHAIEDHLRNG